MFKRDKDYVFISDEIDLLMKHVPKNAYREGYKPKYITIKWTSLYDCVKFIMKYYSSFENSRLSDVKAALSKIREKVGWNNLLQLLEIMNHFVEGFSRDPSTISDI